jgi:hypothetical protein
MLVMVFVSSSDGRGQRSLRFRRPAQLAIPAVEVEELLVGQSAHRRGESAARAAAMWRARTMEYAGQDM